VVDYSTDSMVVQLQNLRADYQASKRKVWLELVVTSFATLAFSLSLIWFSRGARLDVPVSILSMPAVLNTFAWVFWCGFSLPALLRGTRFPMGHSYGDDRDLYREMDRLRLEFYRARRIEQFMDIATASTFIFIAGSLAILVAASNRYL
jgi:hypothetical protein